MPRYVDVENIPKLFNEKYNETKKLISDGEYFLDNIAEGFTEADRIIRAMPTADVVEVVKCKDCKYSREMDKYEKLLYLETCVGCTHHSTSYYSLIMQGDDYCSYGERKEEK